MSNPMVEWFAGVVDAAEERGFIVARVSAGEIELHEFKGRTEIVIRSVYIDGSFLRRLLTPVRPAVETEEARR